MGIDISRLGPAAQAQVNRQLLGQYHPKAESKFHNQTDSRGQLTFDSRKEAQRYDELMVMLRAGLIRDLRLQPQFTLQESYVTPEGERVRAIRYVADFSYERSTTPDVAGNVHWLLTVEDVKSPATKTAVYEIKRKLMQEKFGLAIQEI